MGTGAKAINIDCPACGTKAGLFCHEGDSPNFQRFCPERIRAVAQATFKINQATKAARKKKPDA